MSEMPNFLKKQGKAILFNLDDSELTYYVPEVYFDNTTKTPIAEVQGEYVSTIGLFDYDITDKNGKRTPTKLFKFPTMMLCKPYAIEKVKNIKVGKSAVADDYRLLKFRKGDEVISEDRVPQLTDNVEMFFKLIALTNKFPSSIPYDKIWELIDENARLNGFSYGINFQLIALLISEVCRNPNDITKPFRYTDMKDMNNYKPISIKLLPKFMSPYTAITSENFDQGIQAAVLMKDTPDDKLPTSPVEKIVTM